MPNWGLHQVFTLNWLFTGPAWSEGVAMCCLFHLRECFGVPTSFLPGVTLGFPPTLQPSPPKTQCCGPEETQLFQQRPSNPFCKCICWRITGGSCGEEEIQSALNCLWSFNSFVVAQNLPLISITIVKMTLLSQMTFGKPNVFIFSMNKCTFPNLLFRSS